MLELYCGTETLSLRFLDVAVMNTIVFGGSVEIPTVHTVICPGAAFVFFLVHEDFTPHRREWHLVIIKGPLRCA
jgi:hypothetical protein